MTKSKKLNIFLFSLVLVLSSLLFVACGKPDYSQVYISTSSEYVEVFVGQEKTLTITIENPVANMSKLVKVHVESDKFSIIDTSPMDYSITYTIRGDEGGNGSISFVTDDGAIEKTVDVVVRKYSETFASTSQKMVVTEQSIMIPSDNDFSFDDYVSEKELDFYFYGLYDESAENVAAGVKDDGGAYIKSFVSVKVEKIGEYDYLIFEDKFENLYTVAKSILYTENKLYFVNVDYSQEDGYTLAGIVGNYEYYTISAGEKFSFVAKYNTIDAAGENVELTAIKHFVYYKSISSAATEITYKENTQEAIFNKVAGALENTITIEGIDRDIVTLIPSYTPTIDGVGTVDFLTAYVVIKINNYNELIKFKAYSANDNVVTSKFLGQSVSGDIVCYQLTCAQGNKANTSFVVEFYYDEFENSNNGLVNYKCEIPVEIRNIPKGEVENGDTYFYTIYKGNGDIDKVKDPYSQRQKVLLDKSVIYDHSKYKWNDENWENNPNRISRLANAENKLTPVSSLRIYEANIATLTKSHSFDGAKKALKSIKQQGFNAIELMPVENTYSFNWGYDGVDKFAVSEYLGGPDKLKELIDEAHLLGLNVIMDIVPNHLGCDGASLKRTGPYIGGAPAVIVAFSQSFGLGLAVLIAIVIIQTIEGNVLQTLIISKTTKLNPVIIIIGLLIFGHFFGIVGMLLSTPIISVIKVVITYFDDKYDILNFE